MKQNLTDKQELTDLEAEKIERLKDKLLEDGKGFNERNGVERLYRKDQRYYKKELGESAFLIDRYDEILRDEAQVKEQVYDPVKVYLRGKMDAADSSTPYCTLLYRYHQEQLKDLEMSKVYLQKLMIGASINERAGESDAAQHLDTNAQQLYFPLGIWIDDFYQLGFCEAARGRRREAHLYLASTGNSEVDRWQVDTSLAMDDIRVPFRCNVYSPMLLRRASWQKSIPLLLDFLRSQTERFEESCDVQISMGWIKNEDDISVYRIIIRDNGYPIDREILDSFKTTPISWAVQASELIAQTGASIEISKWELSYKSYANTIVVLFDCLQNVDIHYFDE